MHHVHWPQSSYSENQEVLEVVPRHSKSFKPLIHGFSTNEVLDIVELLRSKRLWVWVKGKDRYPNALPYTTSISTMQPFRGGLRSVTSNCGQFAIIAIVTEEMKIRWSSWVDEVEKVILLTKHPDNVVECLLQAVSLRAIPRTYVKSCFKPYPSKTLVKLPETFLSWAEFQLCPTFLLLTATEKSSHCVA
jgi:hypothetical protein